MITKKRKPIPDPERYRDEVDKIDQFLQSVEPLVERMNELDKQKQAVLRNPYYKSKDLAVFREYSKIRKLVKYGSFRGKKALKQAKKDRSFFLKCLNDYFYA